MVIIKEIYCKNILVKSGISDSGYSLNPYTGCEHNCQYCYAVFMKKFTNHKERWGEFVDVKINAKDVLLNQIKKIKDEKIFIGTACDPYQPLEEKYKITRSCLEVLKDYKNEISILTKSDLILRDIDILKSIENIEVGFSITIFNENYKKIFEPNSTNVIKRFEALKLLSEKGIKTWVFVAPIIPSFSDDENNLKNIFEYSIKSGVSEILFDSLNLYPSVFVNIKNIYKRYFPERLKEFYYYQNNKKIYLHNLKEKIKIIEENFKIHFDFCF